MRNNAQNLAFQFTPAIGIAVSELEEINRPLKLILPRIWVNLGLLVIYLDKGAGTNHRVKRVVIHPNEPVEIFPKAQILNECDRYFAPSLHHAGEEIGLFNPRSRIEPHWKTHTSFRVIDLGRNEMSLGQFDGEASRVDLIQIDSKEKKEVHEINSIECAQCEQFVDARDPCGVLDLDQRTVGDAVSLVPLCTRDQAAIHLHISTADAQSFAQSFETLPRRARRIPRLE
jgi:hypothetical protein